MIFTPRIDQRRSEVVSLASITQAIKGASAHLMNRRLNRTGAVWQEESFDHVLRSSESLDAKVEYILNNPCRKGLVQRPEDYPWLWVARAHVGPDAHVWAAGR